MKDNIVKYGLFGLVALLAVGFLSKFFGGKIPSNPSYPPPTGSSFTNEKPGGCGCGMKK